MGDTKKTWKKYWGKKNNENVSWNGVTCGFFLQSYQDL